MSIKRPQSPMKSNGDYFYPMTAASQVVMDEENGKRLNSVIDEIQFTIDNFEIPEGEFVPITGGAYTGAVEYVTLSGGNISSSGDITAAGNITGAKVYGAVYNDYAEFFPRGEETEIGDLVALDINAAEEQYIKAIKGDKCLAIHTGEYAHLIGGEKAPNGEDYFEYNIKNYIPIALAGRVHVKVIGKVKKGDYIVASDIPGVGIVGDKEYAVGYCVENNDSEDIKLVKVRVI